MTERLLQYIWQFQQFNKTELTTIESEWLQILEPGLLNSNQGPDFLDAKIRLGNTTWAGSIELHLRSSDWKNHKHEGDVHYNNVILHVVWLHDRNINIPFSTLVLQDRVSKLLLKKYEGLMQSQGFIPCEKSIHLVPEITWTSWKQRMAVERLETKTRYIYEYLSRNNHHWEECFWWLLAKHFGSKVNGLFFEKLAQSIPLSILAKHKQQLQQVEALLFGQAGLLEGIFAEDHPNLLKKEYQFLKHKYGLKKVQGMLMFLRMRPSNFPTVRLAQMAMLVHRSSNMFSNILATDEIKKIRNLLQVCTGDYWNSHYLFDQPGIYRMKILGAQMADILVINAVIPMIFTYGIYHDDKLLKEKALNWLDTIKPEKNSFTKGFEALGVSNNTAFDSQAFIHLKNEYCAKLRCLDCSIGNKLIR